MVFGLLIEQLRHFFQTQVGAILLGLVGISRASLGLLAFLFQQGRTFRPGIGTEGPLALLLAWLLLSSYQ